MFLVLCLAMIGARAAVADERAPALRGEELRQRARFEFEKLFRALPSSAQKSLTGAYLAFDPSPGDLLAQVGCDDDGDYVVIVTDAMLHLASNVAFVLGEPEVTATDRLDAYASLLVRERPWDRLPPPPGGFHVGARTPEESADYESALGFLLAHEIARLAHGDIACGSPTTTKERGDDRWTDAEQKRALTDAKAIYPANGAARDREGVDLLIRVGEADRGAVGLARFFDRVYERAASPLAPFSYLATHPPESRTSRLEKAFAEGLRDQGPIREHTPL